MLDVTKGNREVWSWSASTSKGMPEYLVPYFQTLDDIKIDPTGTNFLITSSGGGVAIVDIKTGATLFMTKVPNAHSGAWLPGNLIAVASSTHDRGNYIEVIQWKTGQKVWQDSLYSAHGVVWDDLRNTLYALGFDELIAYSPVSKSGKFKKRSSYPLPGKGGHDLQPAPHTPILVGTDEEGVWYFHRDQQSFAPHMELANINDVKSVSVHPDHGATAYVKADQKWWSHQVKFIGKDYHLSDPDHKFYKARWVQPAFREDFVQAENLLSQIKPLIEQNSSYRLATFTEPAMIVPSFQADQPPDTLSHLYYSKCKDRSCLMLYDTRDMYIIRLNQFEPEQITLTALGISFNNTPEQPRLVHTTFSREFNGRMGRLPQQFELPLPDAESVDFTKLYRLLMPLLQLE